MGGVSQRVARLEHDPEKLALGLDPWVGTGFQPASPKRLRFGEAGRIRSCLKHDPEKWEPVFGQDHAQSRKIDLNVACRVLAAILSLHKMAQSERFVAWLLVVHFASWGNVMSDKRAVPNDPSRKGLTPAAERALAEAAARRAEIDRKTAERPKEVGGPQGPEPTRYGDWEKKGLTSDF